MKLSVSLAHLFSTKDNARAILQSRYAGFEVWGFHTLKIGYDKLCQRIWERNTEDNLHHPSPTNETEEEENMLMTWVNVCVYANPCVHTPERSSWWWWYREVRNLWWASDKEFPILLRMLWHGNTTVAVSTNCTYVTNIWLQRQWLWRLQCSKMWHHAVWEMCIDTLMASLGLQERVSNQWHRIRKNITSAVRDIM